MDNTIIQQGRFTSDGNNKTINLRGGVDWMTVYNRTQWDTTQTPGRGIQFEWLRGLEPSEGLRLNKATGTNVVEGGVSDPAFTLLPIGPGPLVTGTTITKAAPPVCTATAHGLANGDLVILSNLTNMPQLGVTGITIGNVTTNTFELSFFDTNTANFTAETSFEVRSFPDFDFKPSLNWISFITPGSTTQIQLTALAPHLSYEIGSVMRFKVPEAYGMPEINGLSGEILSIDTATNTYTVNIDSSSFTPFAYPASSAFPTDLPIITLIGTNSTIPNDAVENLAVTGMLLHAGIDAPAGSDGDIIFWKAGKSFSVDLE